MKKTHETPFISFSPFLHLDNEDLITTISGYFKNETVQPNNQLADKIKEVANGEKIPLKIAAESEESKTAYHIISEKGLIHTEILNQL